MRKYIYILIYYYTIYSGQTMQWFVLVSQPVSSIKTQDEISSAKSELDRLLGLARLQRYAIEAALKLT
jgi:hypothetical protein